MKVRLLSLLVLPLFVGAAMAITTSATSAQQTQRPLFAILRGSEEVPGPGDPDGIGVAGVQLDAAGGKICTDMAVANIETATAAHIHRGPAGVAGPVVVDFTGLLVPGTSIARGCVTVNPTVIAAIAANPSGYYVNVHNARYPAGAVRGQLQ
jgi:hypothetical protein